MATNDYGSLEFFGSEVVTIPHSDSYNFAGGDFALDVAFKTSTVDAGPVELIGKYDASVGWKIYFEGGVLKVTLNALTYTVVSVVNDNEWHSIHISVDRTAEVAYVFIDGELENTFSIAGQSSFDNAVDLLFGTNYEGLLSEIRLSNRVRYTSSFNLLEMQLSDDYWTVGLFHFNEGQSGTTVTYDSSTVRNHGALDSGLLFREGPHIIDPVATVRGQVWMAIDNFAPLTRWLDSRVRLKTGTARNFDGKYRFRTGDNVPPEWTTENTPALIVVPTSLPDIEEQTSAYHSVFIPIVIRGMMFHKSVDEISQFWFLTLKALFSMYNLTNTAGRFNWIAIQHMRSRGPSFEIQEIQDNTLMSRFEDTLLFEVHHDFLG